VPTFNRSAALRSTIDDLLRQSYKSFELWIVDQSALEEAAQNRSYIDKASDPRLHYLHLPTPGLPNARNEGLRRASGEIIMFVDDDVILLSTDFLAAHVAAFRHPKVGGVTGRHVERSVRTNCRRTANYVSWSGRTVFNLFGTERQRIGSCKGSNMSFRAAAIAQVGGFDRNTNLMEDTDFSVRVAKAGWHLIFEPKAELVHLSVRAGGVRQRSAIETEYERFRSTAYYVYKHRGYFGFAPFVATFTLIAISRALRYRSIKVFTRCQRAMLMGLSLAKSGPDQLIEMQGSLERVRDSDAEPACR
jgi:GT2 family glycosyltransferase